MAFFNKLNPFGAPGLRTLGKSAPIKKLGMSPKPAAPKGIGPSTGQGGDMQNVQNLAQQAMNQPGPGIPRRPMRDMGTGPSIFQGGGGGGTMMRPQMQDMRQRSPWEMGGMQNRLQQMMGQQGQLQGTPVGEMGTDISTAESGVMPTPQAQGQAMQQPGAGPSPDMMQQLMQRMGGNRGFGGGMRARFGGGGFGGQQQF